MRNMGCEEYHELTSASVDEQLGGEELLRLEGHLEGCPACREFEAGVRRVRGLLRTAATLRPLRRPPAGFAASVMRRIADEPPATPRLAAFPARRPVPIWAGLAAAAAAVVFFAWSLFRLLPAEQPAQMSSHPAPIMLAAEGSMEGYLQRHAALARDTTLLGPAAEVDFVSYHVGSRP